MADPPTREEFDAKLATVEARAETRFTELSGKIDRIADSISSFSSTVKGELIDLRAEMRAVKSDNKFTRVSIIIAVVAAVLAGLGALWVTNTLILTSFQSGIALHDAQTTSPHPPTTSPK
jgi:hypothetical protein